MNLSRLLLPLIAGCCLLSAKPAYADDAPFSFGKQFSVEMTVALQAGPTMTSKMFCDTGKIRMEVNAQGMDIIQILRSDTKKAYTVLVAQKSVMEMPYNDEQFKKMDPSAPPEGKIEKIGPDKADGIDCTKYKITSPAPENKVLFCWVDSNKIPVKMQMEDNSMTMSFKNYKAGAQDATLFDPPADYKVTPLPSASGAGAPPSAPPPSTATP